MELKRNGGMPPGGMPTGKNLPENDAHFTGYGATKAEMKRGYIADEPLDSPTEYTSQDGGFLGRQRGSWNR